MSRVCDRHFLYLSKIKVYSSLTTALQSFLSFKSRVLLNVTFSGPKIQNHINSISMCQVLIVSKIWCCWFCEWICKPPNVPLWGFSQRSHTYMPLEAREVMYKSETEFNTRHSGGPEATWRASIPPTTAAQLLPHDVLRECQLHIAKFTIFSKTVWNIQIFIFRHANVLSCKCWQLMLFSFLLNTMQPSSLDHHSVTSTLGILREDVRCATVCFYPSLFRNFTSLLSHTQGDVSRNTTLPLGGHEFGESEK